jgi:undecaprenyldiphospho-muramoylpentapeptide beta-N-acetylglucosaminyltransferase
MLASFDANAPGAHPSVLITGGGTAGHVEPALAVARALCALGVANDDIVFVGARRGMEASMIPAAGFAVRLLPGRGLVPRLAVANLASLLQLGRAFFEALWIVRRARPEVVVMVGGYAGVACSLAAAILRVPIVVVNVDAAVGRANRLVGRFAAVNAVSSAETGLPRAVLTGAPVRDAVLAADRSVSGRATAKEVLDLGLDDQVLAVVGGSLGARTLNRLALQLRSALKTDQKLWIYHVCGARNESEVRAELAVAPAPAENVEYRLVPYEDNVPALFSAADLVITRAGAMTVAEIAIIGVPAILVPLPGAPGDHQAENARGLESVGAAVLVPDEAANSPEVTELVATLLGDIERLSDMAEAAKTMARPQAAIAIADVVRTTMERARRPRRSGRGPAN